MGCLQQGRRCGWLQCLFFGAPNNARKGGSAVMVRRHLPSRPAWNFADNGGAAQLVWVGGYLIGSVYFAPF